MSQLLLHDGQLIQETQQAVRRLEVLGSQTTAWHVSCALRRLWPASHVPMARPRNPYHRLRAGPRRSRSRLSGAFEESGRRASESAAYACVFLVLLESQTI